MLRAIAIGVLAAAATSRETARADITHPVNAQVPAPHGIVTRLPGEGNQLALTVDDGTNSAVVAAYAQFCRDSGVRLTFFPNGVNTSWSVNAPLLAPMVESGQIQVGNHTWSHPNITRIGLDAVADQIRRNADFLRNTFGTDGTPTSVRRTEPTPPIPTALPPTWATPRSRCGAAPSAIRDRLTSGNSSPSPSSHSSRSRSS